MIESYLSKLLAADLTRLEDLPYNDLEGLRTKLQESKSLFYEYYFTKENKAVGVRKYTPSEVKNITNTIRTLYRDTPFARLENGWILGKSKIHFYFNSPDFSDFALTYEEMAKVSWHRAKKLFSDDRCSFCNPSGIYIGVDCGRMEEIKTLFENYPESNKKWEAKIYEIVDKINELLKTQLSESKSTVLLDLDKDSNGEIDLIENDFNKIIVQNQKKIIEIDRNYIQQFVKISNYIKTKRSNTQKIFESIGQTKNQKELEARVNLIRNQIHAYEHLVFHSISMVSALLTDDMITFYEIYEALDKLGIFNSNWQNEVSAKLDRIGNQLNSLLVAIYQMENSIVSELSNLSYTTSESFSSLQSAMETQLSGIKSGISVNNLLSGIQSYQLYRLNQNLLS
jgi:hypothetical protein